MILTEPEDVLFDGMNLYHAAAVGRAIAALPALEHEIDELIWQLAGIEADIGVCLTAQFGTVAARMESLISLARLREISELELKTLDKFMGHVVAAGHKRNRLAHDCWFHGMESGQHYRLNKTAKRSLDFGYKCVSEEDVKAIEAEFAELVTEFRSLRTRILTIFYRW